MLEKLRRESIPLYVVMADLLRRRIARDNWSAGSRLPTLNELTAEFGVSRVTARQAMAVLSSEGLIVRQQGRGTFVAARPERTLRLRVETSLEGLASVYNDTRPDLALLAEGMEMPVLAPDEGTAAPAYRFMHRVHRRDEVPYCVIRIFLDERIFRRAPLKFQSETVIPLLLQMPGVAIGRAWQTLTIASADVETARHLNVPVNAPVADVRRVFTSPSGTVIYLGEVTYRGDLIHLEMKLKN